jgi:hypothetical protein
MKRLLLGSAASNIDVDLRQIGRRAKHATIAHEYAGVFSSAASHAQNATAEQLDADGVVAVDGDNGADQGGLRGQQVLELFPEVGHEGSKYFVPWFRSAAVLLTKIEGNMLCNKKAT